MPETLPDVKVGDIVQYLGDFRNPRPARIVSVHPQIIGDPNYKAKDGNKVVWIVRRRDGTFFEPGR